MKFWLIVLFMVFAPRLGCGLHKSTCGGWGTEEGIPCGERHETLEGVIFEAFPCPHNGCARTSGCWPLDATGVCDAVDPCMAYSGSSTVQSYRILADIPRDHACFHPRTQEVEMAKINLGLSAGVPTIHMRVSPTALPVVPPTAAPKKDANPSKLAKLGCTKNIANNPT